MKKINCVIIDDEELARTLLETYIAKVPHLHLSGKFKNPLEAMETIQMQQVDLLFLDIQMPELTGIEFLKTLRQRPLVIFTTAYSDYALEGYELDITDYLLKPFGFNRFMIAVNKAAELLKLMQGSTATTSDEIEKSTTDKEYILVKSEHRIHRIKLDEIRYIQSMREYVAFFQKEGKILSLYSLKKLEKELPSDQFIRIHKSYIVPIKRIEALEGNMLKIGADKLPIGASYREEVLRRVFGN